jgi:regulator of replication initiation timing
MDDRKYPPHILGNYQKSPEPEEDCLDCKELLLRYHTLNEQYSKMEEELMNKLMDKEVRVDELYRVVGEQDKKIKMLEKKERARLKKGPVRKGKNPFGLRSRGGKTNNLYERFKTYY